jgi:histone acetyltransferase (RNA polymerase elongator complex component)
MNNTPPFLEISPAFTVEDIRKIRMWNHERYKTMTPEEICEDTRRESEKFLALMSKPATLP